MDPIVFPLFAQAFGSVAGGLLRKAAEKHVQTFFGQALDSLAAKGQKDPLVQAMENAYGACFEIILRTLLGLGFDPDDFKPYEKAVRRFLDDETVAEELLKPAIDIQDRLSPDAEVLKDAWSRLECPELPEGFSWPNVVSGYRLQLNKEKIASATLREEFSAANLLDIREEMRKIAGVQPEADVVRYGQRMRQKYRVLDLSALQSPTVDEPGRILVRDAFVPQNVREDPPADEIPKDLLRKLAEDGEWSKDEVEKHEELERQIERVRDSFVQRKPRPVLEIVAEPDCDRLVILGGPGSGKSTLVRYLLLSLLDLNERTEVPPWLETFHGSLPLLLELREFIAERDNNRCENFLEYWHILGKTDGYFLDARWLDNSLRDKPSLILIDGLDEIFDSRDREKITEMIVGLGATYPRARLIVTSYPVGYQKKTLDNAGFRHFAIEDLNEEQIETFVRGWFRQIFPNRPQQAEQRVERVLATTKTSPPIRLLAGNPMLLTIMTLIAQLRELPRDRWRFYDYSAEVLCHHWDVNRHLVDSRHDAPYVGLEDKKEMLGWIAFHMQEGANGLAGNVIRGAKLLKVIEDYLKTRYELMPAEANRVADALIDQLRKRNYILCMRAPGLYGFVHRTFLEYFCALQLVDLLEKNPEFTVDTLKNDYFSQRWQDPSWTEPLRLICAMVGVDYAVALIDELVVDGEDWPLTDENVAIVNGILVSGRSLPPRLALAAKCLEEIEDRPEAKAVSSKFREIVVPQIHSTNVPIRIAVVQSLAQIWSQDEDIRQLLVERARIDENEYVRRAAVRSLALTWSQDEDIRQLLVEKAQNDEDEDVRCTAIQSLALTWSQDEDIRQLLVARAQDDENKYVRRAAVQSLAQAWSQDEDIRQLIVGRAQNDEDEIVRRAAVQSLMQTWSQDEDIRQLLVERVQNDESGYVRRAAVQSLAQGWSQDNEIRQLIAGRALRDEHYDVRSAAIQSLAQTSSQDDNIRQLITERIQEDESFNVRRAAIQTLSRSWSHEPQTIQLIIDRALNDTDSRVRRDAVTMLSQLPFDVETTQQVVMAIASREDDFHSDTLKKLSHIWSHDDQIEMITTLVAQSDKSHKVRAMGVQVLLRSQRVVDRELYESLLQDSSERVRLAAAMHINVEEQDFDILGVLEAAYMKDDNDDVRAAIISRLDRLRGQPGSGRSKGVLIRAAEADSSSIVRYAALNVLMQWSPRDLRILTILRTEYSNTKESRQRDKLSGLLRRAYAAGSEVWYNWLTGRLDMDYMKLPFVEDCSPVWRVRKLRLRNIKSFKDTGEVHFGPANKEVAGGRIVLLGENATGKTTLVKCIALASIGAELSNQIEARPESYLRMGAEIGVIEVLFEVCLDRSATSLETAAVAVGIVIRRGENRFIPARNAELSIGVHNINDRLEVLRSKRGFHFGLFCAYGPTRGMNDNDDFIARRESKNVLDRISSLFKPETVLIGLEGFQASIAEHADVEIDNDALSRLISSFSERIGSLAPGVSSIEVAESVSINLYDKYIDFDSLSDGYKSLLSMIGHLLRHAVIACPSSARVGMFSGVVLIDEIDLHLHPKWQRFVMQELMSFLGDAQIVVTSHSPMILGGMWDDVALLLTREGDEVTISADLPSVKGWRADQILTGIFNLPTTRDIGTESLFKEYAEVLGRHGPENERSRELRHELLKTTGREGEDNLDEQVTTLLRDAIKMRYSELDEESKGILLARASLYFGGG